MATDILLDATSDIDVTAAGGTLVSGIGELIQRLTVSLQMATGEAWLRLAWGLRYHELWLGADVDERLCESDLRTQLARMPGIASVRDVRIVRNPSARSMAVTFAIVASSAQVVEVTTAVTEDGTSDTLSITVDGELYAPTSIALFAGL